MTNASKYARRRRCLALLLVLVLLAIVPLAAASCASKDPSSEEQTSQGGSSKEGWESDPEQFPGENTLSEESSPEESLQQESDPEENSPGERFPEESDSHVSTLPEESGVSPEESFPAEEVFGDEFCYVALGDSICRGYGLSDPETQRYSSLIGRQTGCKVYNYGVDGQTGSELLTFLREGKAKALPKADVISVSIGANNLLSTLSTLLRALFNDFTASGTESSMDAESFFAAVDEALASFEQELPEIIELLRAEAPDAQILFQTVYNPYRSFTHFPVRLNGTKTYLAELADGCVTRLNDMIRAGAQTYGYTVCDVYDAFEQNADQLVNASLSKINFDPHPNAAGHAVIAEALLKMMPKEY